MAKPKLIDHLILILGSLVMLLPVLSVFLTTTHAPGTFARDGLALTYGDYFFSNYTQLFTTSRGFTDSVTASGMMFNSVIIGIGFAGLKVLLSLMAAFGLHYFKVRFRTLIFWLIFASLLFPLESRFLPTYAVTAQLGLINTYSGVIFPLAASGIGTLFFRQFLRTVPDQLAEAARIDGAGPLRFFIDILVPLSAPMAGALFLILFIIGWNQYLWPIMITTDESLYTLVRGMQFIGYRSTEGMALAMLAILPPVVLLLMFQRLIVKGLYEGIH